MTSAAERAAYPGFTLVAQLSATDVIGFVQVIETEDLAHLEQLSVLPQHGRQGYGRLLVYASCGFVPSIPSTPFHHRLVEVESRLGLDRLGARLQMTASLV